MNEEHPKVGVGVVIFKEGGKLLLAKRKSKLARGYYSSSGGHLENGESFEVAVLREISEENGVTVKNLKFLCVSHIKDHPPHHYVDIGFSAEWESGEPKVLEPDKFEDWNWYDLDNLPEPLFGTIHRYLDSMETGRTLYDE